MSVQLTTIEGKQRKKFTAAVTRPDFWKIIGATSRTPRRKEDRSGYLIIIN